MENVSQFWNSSLNSKKQQLFVEDRLSQRTGQLFCRLYVLLSFVNVHRMSFSDAKIINAIHPFVTHCGPYTVLNDAQTTKCALCCTTTDWECAQNQVVSVIEDILTTGNRPLAEK